jgi:hypothetical protein
LIVFTVMAGISAMIPLEALAATETIIYNFMGPSDDGSNGYGGRSYNLVQDATGPLLRGDVRGWSVQCRIRWTGHRL